MTNQFQQRFAEEFPVGPPNTRTQTPSYDNTPHTFYPWLEPASRITPASDSLAIQAMGWEDELQSCQEMGFLSSDIMSYYSGYEDLEIYHGEWPPISADTEHSQPRLLPLQGPDPSSDLSERGRSQFETSTIPKSPERPAVKRKPGRSQYKVQKQPIQRLPKRSSRAPYLPRTPCPIPGCEVTVARPTDIRRHLSTRHGGERYACLLCAAERGNANRVEHLYGTKYNLLEHVSKIHPTVPEDNEMLACMRSMKEFFPSESEYTAPTGSSGPSSEPWDAVMQQESSTSSNDGFILNSNENIEYSSRSVFADIGESSFFSAEPERTAGLIYDVEAMIEQALRQDVEQFRASAAYSSFEQSLAVPVGPEIPSFGIV